MAIPDTLETVIFDFDGTIADSLEEARLVVNILSAEMGFKSVLAEELDAMRKLTLSEILKELGISKLQLPRIISKGTKLLKSRITEVALIGGITGVIEQLRPRVKQMGILTSNSVENVNLFLEKNGLSEHFDFIKSTSKLSSKAKSLKNILKETDSLLTNTVYIGDEVSDIEACQKLGLPVIAVPWGFNDRELLLENKPDALLETTDELLDTLLRSTIPV